MNVIATDNKCGSCRVCCEVPLIQELGKPEHTLCEHYDSGCTIYQGRPKDCELYQCIWITQDSIDVRYRPDKLGVVFEPVYTKKFWIGIELEENALQKEDCARLIQAMNNDGCNIILKSLNGVLQHSLVSMTPEEILSEYMETR